jgi:hypothetical protein
MAFARLSSSTCCSSELECRCCRMTVLPVLACRLNMCYAYPANAAMPAWKWGPSGLDTTPMCYFHIGSSWLRIGKSAIGIAAVSARRLSHKEVSATCASFRRSHPARPDDSCHPRLRRVEGYHRIDLTLVLAMGYRHATTVDRSVPVVVELAECVVQPSRKPRAMLAHGAKSPILSDGDVGVVFHVHLKT